MLIRFALYDHQAKLIKLVTRESQTINQSYELLKKEYPHLAVVAQAVVEKPCENCH